MPERGSTARHAHSGTSQCPRNSHTQKGRLGSFEPVVDCSHQLVCTLTALFDSDPKGTHLLSKCLRLRLRRHYTSLIREDARSLAPASGNCRLNVRRTPHP